MTDPLVSVVITNHNYGRYLGFAVDSALSQTHPRVEVVVVDDGSTDDSREVLASYGARIRTVVQDNAGQAAAMNAGVAVAAGSLVAFLDADDVLEADAVSRLVAVWEPGVARVQGPVSLLGGDGRPAGGRLPADPMPSGDLRGLVLRSGGYPATGTTGSAYARAVLDRLLPIPETEWRRAPDTYLLLLAPFCGEVRSLDRVLGGVRIHDDNQWSMRELHVRRLRDYLDMDLRKAALLRERAGDLGFEYPVDWLLRNPHHLQARLATLRLKPNQHPFPGDGAWELGFRGAAVALRARRFSARKRLMLAAWFLLAGTLPRPAARPLIRAGYLRSRRPAWVQGFIQGAGRRGAGAAD